MARVALLLLAGCSIGPAIYVDKTGDGEVTSEPEGLHCGDDCAMIVDGGVITLTATPARGSTFAGWGIDGCDGATCTIELAADTRVAAHFEAIHHEVTVERVGAGVVEIDGERCDRRCAVREGDVTITAHPFAFAWGGACEGTPPGTACRLTVDGPRHVRVQLAEQPVLTVEKIGEGHVHSFNAVGIDCGAACSAPFPRDFPVMLRAQTAPGYTFDGWDGPCTTIDGDCRVYMNMAHTIRARFASAGCLAQNETGAVFSARLMTPNTTICVEKGVTITGPVIVGAPNVTVRSPGTARFINPSGVAIEIGNHTGIRLEGVEVTSSGGHYIRAIHIGSGGVELERSTVRCDVSSCYGVHVEGGAVRMTNSTIVSGIDSVSIGIYGNGAVALRDSMIAGVGDGIYVRGAASTIDVVDSVITTTHAFTSTILVDAARATVRQSTLRTRGRAIDSSGTVTIDASSIRKLAGSPNNSAPFTSANGAWHATTPNTFCHEGTATTDGVFTTPFIDGPKASTSTFDNLTHTGPGDCP